MPVRPCIHQGKPGYKWGHQGKCYTYTPGDEASRARAYASARKQGVAVQIREQQDADSYRPTAEMARIARNVLELRASLPASQRAGTPVGIARARDIAARKNLSLRTIRRMVSFFARHGAAPGSAKARQNPKSKAAQAWALWGGTPGRVWAKRVLREAERERADAPLQEGKRPIPSSHRRYQRFLVRYMKALRRAVMRSIEDDFRAAAREELQNERADSISRYLARILRNLAAVQVAAQMSQPELEDELDELGASIDQHTSRQTAIALGAEITMIDAFSRGPTKALISTWVGENVSKITTLSDTLFGQLASVIETGAREALSTETIRRQIEKRFDVGESWAKFIARDQIASLNAKITRKKQEDLGVKQYRWSTSGDERVRDMHVDLDGLVFSWDEAPITNKEGERNHPGEDYNCRCVAIPIIDLTRTE